MSAPPSRIAEKLSSTKARWIRDALLILLMAAVAWTAHVQHNQSEKLQRSEQATISGCNHIATLTGVSNQRGYSDYIILEASLSSIEKIPPPKRSPAIQRFHRDLLVALQASVWVPKPNCKAEVAAHGANYRLPEPVHFSERFPPLNERTPHP